MDGVVARLDPTDLGVRAHLQRKLQTLIAEPQPHAARRAGFREAGEDGADRSNDGLIGMKQNLAVGLTPHTKPTGKPRRSSPRAALLRMPPLRRARSTCSSASLIVPFNPSSKRSLNNAG